MSARKVVAQQLLVYHLLIRAKSGMPELGPARIKDVRQYPGLTRS
ncbi:hypothetical protein ABDI30_12085 [Paenibacillus cisolokensis]